MFCKSQILTAACSASLLATSASGTVIQIDVGRSDSITTDTGWNNLNNGANSGTFATDFGVTDMVDSTGAATAIDIRVDSTGGGSWAGSGADFLGTAPSPFNTAPTNAIKDSMFIRGTSVDIVISDLTAGYTYGLLLWGARGNNGEVVDADIVFTVTDGTGTYEGSYADGLNNPTVVSFADLVADVNGEITITYEGETVAGLPSNATSSESGALNVIQLTETVPEPGSLALLSLGGLLVARRRRNG